MTVSKRDKPSPVPRPRPAPRRRESRPVESGAPESGRVNGRLAGMRPGKPGRRATVLACLTAIAVLFSVAAAWFALEANRLREGSPESNSAIVEAEATAEVRKQVSSAVESIFSYNYASPERTRRAAERVLLDEALRKYNAKLSEAGKAAQQRKLVRTTSVRAIGVRTLHDGTARVLVFLDQQTRTDGSKRKTSTAYLDVVAKQVDGSWKIAELSGV